ncbi:MAG: hypothetical protein IPP83_05285 [Flavobacteriales bacterium]|nr:hypothetical protein [Flavobacteriales bacterium]
MFLRSVFVLFVLSGATAFAQVEVPARAEQQTKATAVQDPVQGGWAATPAAVDHETLDLFDATRTPAQELDGLRMQRNEALSRNKGSYTAADKQQLDLSADRINSAYPNSFEAHMANFYASFPTVRSFTELGAAATNAPERIELVGPQLAAAARQDDQPTLVARAKDMKARGGVAPPLYLYAEDLLKSVDEKGVLIAAGEMDAYPLWVKQFAEGKRTDVLVIDRRMLPDPEYRGRMWGRAGATGTVPPDEASFIAKLHTSTGRPVFLSLAVGAEVARTHAALLSVTGLAMRMSESARGDMAKLGSLWKGMRKPTDAGPISKNYLIPGSLLLKYYRAMDDERNASELEAELRIMAQQLGATQSMITNGIFLH